MKIICIYAPGNGGECNSAICDHRLPHEEGELDETGGCKWAKDPHCVPAVGAEIERVLRSWFGEILDDHNEATDRVISGATRDLFCLYKKEVPGANA